MFSFFKRKGKAEPETAEPPRGHPTDNTLKLTAVDPRAPHELTKTSKDVVNLLIPETDYHQKTGVGAILEIMARKRRKPKRKARSESCRVSPPKTNLQRTSSLCDARAPDAAKNNARVADESTEYAKPLVPQHKPEKHVSLVYVNETQERNAEALLRQIARTIDTAVDEINETKQMGGADSKLKDKYENTAIDCYKNELKGELEKLLKDDVDDDAESPSIVKKSNMKPPRSDTEGCSDDDRSDCGKKKVTFRKHIIFDDGEQQTDEEVDSSFESLTSGEEEEYLEDMPESENKTVIDVKNNDAITIKITPEDGLKRVYSDNSDSGFVDDKNCADDITSEVKSLVSESETEEEIVEEVEEIEEEVEEIEEEVEVEEVEEEVEEEIEEEEHEDDEKTLVSQESKFQSQVAALAELADSRGTEADRARDLIAAYRKQIEAKDQEIEQLKCELAAAYKESELVRQRSRSLEEELTAARGCSAELADQLHRRNDESLRQIRAELEDAQSQRAELESRVLALEQDKSRLEQEKVLQEQKAQEALAAAEANTAKWRLAHEAARSQAAARAERMLADCEWKMRELEKKARDAEKQKKELAETVEQLKEAPKPTPSHVAELQQLRGLATEQQRSVQALTLQLQRVETREEALKLEVHRLKELLERETVSGKEKEERHQKVLKQLEEQHSKAVEGIKAEQAAAAAATRAALERAHAERTRAALAQLRQEAEHEAKNADRKLREVTTRFENLKEVLASKEAQFEHAIAEAHSKADWDILQLRHLLDKADITYANNIEQLTERFEKEKETLIEEWSQKLKEVEDEAATAADEAKKLLESTRAKLVAERVDQVNKLKEKHRQEMDDQWEQFMTDKENCLARMKMECRQEGEEERVKREKELLEEIAELKSQVQSKSLDFDNLAVRAAACGRTLAVTEQELREALAREKELREKRAEDAGKLKQAEKASKEQVEHLTRKCACLRKLFDDMRARLTARERAAEQDSRAKDKELHQLRGEVARLTKILVEQSAPSLGARTRADGCETVSPEEPASKPEPQRRKGGSLRTPELSRKRPTLPELTGLPQPRLTPVEFENGRRRAKSVDLPAVQVPVRIKQLEERSKE
ncbi:myosin-11 isoform X2 [Manduca sexta]|uniref:myosin-11 isoform X2 n=1 Tax=Manduca sexta TaxID=7130 RepID=UPI00188FF4E3|nr:myosin-11 isoform X2 [Manduca sexta]